MIDTILALISTYGLWVIFITILLGCLAIPLPGSMLVLAAGSFAAAGDIDLTYAFAAAFGGYMTGDQTAYRIARLAGPPLVKRLESSKRAGPMIEKAQGHLRKHGVLAIFLSRTFITPMAPWMSYLCGAAKFKWLLFTLSSMVGATLWVLAYLGIGYFFADRIAELATLASDGLGFIAAFAVALLAAGWLWASWRKYKLRSAEPQSEPDDARAIKEPVAVHVDPV